VVVTVKVLGNPDTKVVEEALVTAGVLSTITDDDAAVAGRTPIARRLTATRHARTAVVATFAVG